MFQIIRAGSGFDPVIVASPPLNGAPVLPPAATYYELSSIKDANPPPGWRPGQFNRIDFREAWMAFCGHTDVWGYADLEPDQCFPDMESVKRRVEQERAEWTEARMRECSDPSLTP